MSPLVSLTMKTNGVKCDWRTGIRWWISQIPRPRIPNVGFCAGARHPSIAVQCPRSSDCRRNALIPHYHSRICCKLSVIRGHSRTSVDSEVITRVIGVYPTKGIFTGWKSVILIFRFNLVSIFQETLFLWAQIGCKPGSNFKRLSSQHPWKIQKDQIK